MCRFTAYCSVSDPDHTYAAFPIPWDIFSEGALADQSLATNWKWLGGFLGWSQWKCPIIDT